MKFKPGDRVRYIESDNGYNVAAGYEGVEAEVVEYWVKVRKFEGGKWHEVNDRTSLIIMEDALELIEERKETLEV